uniref:Excisionase n=1 Tax=Steinernema glaseri TaxID=37863 RepID=A0A1I7YNV8_9BILA
MRILENRPRTRLQDGQAWMTSMQ